MAIPFFNRGEGASGGSRPAGYEPRPFLDASILEQLRGEGYILSPTSLGIEDAYSQMGMINKTVVGGKSVPAMQDRSGNVYVADEKRNVYLLERSAVDPTTGVPTGGPVPRNNPGRTGGPRRVPPPSPPNPPSFPPGTGGPLYGPTGPPSGGGGGIPPRIPPGGVIGSGKIYSPFTPDDIVPNQQEIVTRALWSNSVGNLLTFYTSSEQTAAQKDYYYEIFNSSSASDCGAAPQFSVAYGHSLGSGSVDQGGQIEDTPSRAIYGQYKRLCLDPDATGFTIDGTTSTHIYVINVNRARMREYLDEGNIEINLAHLSGSEYVAGGNDADTHTGSAVTLGGAGAVLRLIDDSSTAAATIMSSGEVYNIVSGSIEDGVYNTSSPEYYGLLFRRLGVIVLDADKLDLSASFATVTGREVDGDNSFKLFTAISGAADFTDQSGDYLGFQGRGAEKVKSTHFFCRVKNADYNFSNNPTFVTGSEGDLKHPTMINDPTTYITTVGLYNNRKELMAVAKLSQAYKKTFKDEALIKVKLDF